MNHFPASQYKEFLKLSKKIGSNIELVQGAGGNTSIKDDKILSVKASGKLLSNSLTEEIFVNIDIKKIKLSISENIHCNPNDFLIDKSNLRPSIETLIHAIMPHKYVFHIHCVKSISWIITENYKKDLSKLLIGLDWISLPYCKPGAHLAETLLNAQREKFYEIVFLENHGLIVSANNIKRIEFLIQEISKRLDRPFKNNNIKNKEIFSLKRIKNYYKIDDESINLLARNKSNIFFAGKGSYYPDHVVFLGPGVQVATNLEEFKVKVSQNKLLAPKPIILSGVGVFIPDNFQDQKIEMIKALALVIGRVPENANVRVLTTEQEKELINWEAEKYRQKININ